MSRILLTIAIDDATVGAQGAKEAVVQSLGWMGKIKILRIRYVELSEWICVKDQPPPINTLVHAMSYGYNIFFALKWTGKSWVFPDGIRRVRNVPTHWRPIYEPPEDVSNLDTRRS